MNNQKPFWMPDTQGFLAIAIVLIVGIVIILLLSAKLNLSDTAASLLQVGLGFLFGCFKDVYSFFFGSSKGSEKKDDALISGSISPTSTPPIVPPAQAISTGPAADAAKALSIVAMMVLGALLLFPQPSFAQTKLQSDIDAAVSKAVAKLTAATQVAAATGKAAQTSQGLEQIMSAISKPFQDLADFINSDAAGAATLATTVPGLQDTNGKACWQKMQDAGAVFNAHPVPVTLKVMTDFESLRLLQMTANNLCAYTPCTVVFGDGQSLATAVASAVGGALTSNAVPSLNTICARIPQLSPMLPQAVTGIAPPVATPVSTITPAAGTTPIQPDTAAPAPPSK